jgi:TonB family protein
MYKKVSISVFILLALFSILKAQSSGNNERLAYKMNLTGFDLMSKEKYTEAIPFFDSAILYNNLKPEYYRNRGDAEAHLDKNIKALYDYHSCISLQPSNYEFRYLAGNMYLKIKAYDSAIYFYSKSIDQITDRTNKDLVKLYFSRGNSYLKKENFERALKDYDSVLILDRKYYPCYANRGVANYRLNKKNEACGDWYMASQNGIESAGEYFGKYCGDFTIPENMINKEPEINEQSKKPSLTQTENISTNWFRERTLIDKNGDSIHSVVDQMPEFPGGDSALYRYLHNSIRYPPEALMHEQQGTVYVSFVVGSDGYISNPLILKGVCKALDQESIYLIQAMPRWSPGKHEGKAVPVQFNMPIKFTLLGMPEKDYNSRKNDKFFENGMANLHAGNFDKARVSFTKSINLNNYTGDTAYLYRGICNYKLGDYTSAIGDILHARDQNVEHADSIMKIIFLDIINIFTNQNKYQQAIGLFSVLISAYPDDKDLFFGRGQEYFALGKNPEACEDFKRAKHLGLKEASDMILKCCTK